jgi:ABC-type amino acid transport system permease subunit
MATIDFCYDCSSSSSERDMKIIQFIANAFINTMGITQPSPQAANRAAWFIVIMLAAVLAAVATVAIVAVHFASHH